MHRYTACLLLALLPLAGCSSDPTQGYSFTSTFRKEVQSISVPIWTNTTFQQGLETKLAESLVTELRKATPYTITDADAAQTVLTGTITAAELRPLSTARDSGMVETLAFEVTVDFAWKDNRTGKTLVARRNFTAARSFVPARNVGEHLAVGQNAAIQQLAHDIVAELRSGW